MSVQLYAEMAGKLEQRFVMTEVQQTQSIANLTVQDQNQDLFAQVEILFHHLLADLFVETTLFLMMKNAKMEIQ